MERSRSGRRWLELLLAASATIVGVQLLRVLFPMVGWYLRDTEHVGTTGLLPWALLPFAVGFLAPVVHRLLGRHALPAVASTLSGTWLLVALLSSPRADLWFGAIGVGVFVLLLPLVIAHAPTGVGHGIALGLAGDTAVRALTSTVDLTVVDSGWATLTVLLLAVLLAGTAWMLRSSDPPLGLHWRDAVPLLGFGPLLFVELLMLQNQGWVATVGDIGWVPAVLFLTAANLVSIGAVSVGRVRAGRQGSAVIGGTLVLLVTVDAGLGSIVFLALAFLAHLGAGLYLGAVTAPSTPYEASPSITATSSWLGAGNLLLVAIGLGYYIGYDVAVPLGQPALRLAAGLVVLGTGLGASMRDRATPRPGWPAFALAALLLVAPVLLLREGTFTGRQGQTPGYPIQVASYNVHSGFGTDGTPSLETLAATVEASGASVVGLQEVSRGWLLNGSTDLLGWLQRRLDMPYLAFHATTEDPLWGNAVLSRYPITATSRAPLPELDTLIRRGVLETTLDLGDTQTMRLMTTHLHHTGDLATIHPPQVQAILQEWEQAPRTVLLGDLNARPGWEQVQLLLDAGFVDAWAEAGRGPGYTANAADPTVRIDWILHTEDLRTDDIRVVESQASDHFLVTARIDRAP